MSTVQSNPVRLLTAEEFAKLPDDGSVMELVRGRVVRMPPPGSRHGFVCARLAILLGSFLEGRGLGTVVVESGIITRRNPDGVRGPDVAYFSYERLPKDAMPVGYCEVTPELIFEVRSPDDRWKQVVEKVAEYLNANVLIVCVLDPQTQTAHIYQPDAPVKVYSTDETIHFAPVLPDWQVAVRQFFAAGE